MNVASIRRSKLLVLARIFQNSRSLRSAPRDGHGRGDDDGQTLVDSGGIPTAKPVACEIEFPPIGCGQWVRFVLANDREMITSVPAWRGKVLAAICVLSLSPFVHGFAALPAYSRASRDDQYFYVNGRFVRDKVLAHAAREAYADVLRRLAQIEDRLGIAHE